MNDALNTPVALIIFNRPDLTQRVFNAIADVKPRQLFIVADGPRSPEESEPCAKTRAIIDQVNWDCEVFTNFSDVNLGCKRRVSSGLDWVFEQVEEAIILEDDCVPAPTFFNFCSILLEHYKYDNRVMHISGSNLQNGQKRGESSYYFSKSPQVWGWASWRRAWRHYDVRMESWPKYKYKVNARCKSAAEQRYWHHIFNLVAEGAIDTWDYQWLYACWINEGLCIVPNFNLISNIGFGPDATHTKGESPLSDLPLLDIKKVIHPRLVTLDSEADTYIFTKYLYDDKEKSYTCKDRFYMYRRRVHGLLSRRYRK